MKNGIFNSDNQSGFLSIFIRLGIWLILLSLLFALAKLFSWGGAVVIFLMVFLLIYSQIQNIKLYHREIKLNSSHPKLVNFYCYTGILRSFLIACGGLGILSLIVYCLIYGRDSDFLIDEVVRRDRFGYIFIFLGFGGILMSIHQLLGYLSDGKFITFEYRLSYYSLFIFFPSVLSTLLGFFLLI